MTTTGPLTERGQQALEQMREAQEQGSALKDYAAKIGLDVRRLYELRDAWCARMLSEHSHVARPGSPASKALFDLCVWCLRTDRGTARRSHAGWCIRVAGCSSAMDCRRPRGSQRY